MHVQVGHALADPVVESDKGAFRRQAGFDPSGHSGHGREQRRHRFAGKIAESLVMVARDHQNVAGEYRPEIQKSEGLGVLEHLVCGGGAGDDPAERTRGEGRGHSLSGG